MFCWHSTRLRVVSARIRTDKAIYFRSSLSICWRKLIFRTITSDVSRSYEVSKLEPSSLSPEHDIYISTSTDPFFNLTLEDWYVSFFKTQLCIDQANTTSKHAQFIFYAFDGRWPRRFLNLFYFILFLFSTVVIWQAISTLPLIISAPTDISRFSLCHHRSKSKSVDRDQFHCTPRSTYPIHS